MCRHPSAGQNRGHRIRRCPRRGDHRTRPAQGIPASTRLRPRAASPRALLVQAGGRPKRPAPADLHIGRPLTAGDVPDAESVRAIRDADEAKRSGRIGKGWIRPNSRWRRRPLPPAPPCSRPRSARRYPPTVAPRRFRRQAPDRPRGSRPIRVRSTHPGKTRRYLGIRATSTLGYGLS